jgi:hypothetical protein
MVKILGASNTWNSCWYIILEKGYDISMVSRTEYPNGNIEQIYLAKKQDNEFRSENYLSLLGIISIWETLGDDLSGLIQEGEKLESLIPEDCMELFFEEEK